MNGIVFSDPLALAAAVLAVTLVGLAKGGLGGAMALMGVPLMALVIPPVQAAGILLPILIVMDGVGLWTWWRTWDKRTLVMMLPGALVGIVIGWMTAAMVSDDMVRLIVGVIGIVFVLRWLTAGRAARARPRGHNPAAAALWSTLAGYTSFVAHSGGPPFQVYTMPLRMDPRIFTGTSVAFFAIMNTVKLIPYFALGQFDAANLTTSAVLMPLAAVSTLAGAAVVRRLRAEVFYPIMYVMVVLVSAKLIWDGLAAFA